MVHTVPALHGTVGSRQGKTRLPLAEVFDRSIPKLFPAGSSSFRCGLGLRTFCRHRRVFWAKRVSLPQNGGDSGAW
jgi:hypothetical protein